MTKAPTCVAYTYFLLRAAYKGSIAELAAVIYPFGLGDLYIVDHMKTMPSPLTISTHSSFKSYTSDGIRESTAWMRTLVNQCAESFSGERDAMRKCFLTVRASKRRFREYSTIGEDMEMNSITTHAN
ncbi:thiaminase II/PqqC family protein [Haladaptatus caseinilyticus]|uniref:hypothetical protein n=1 Tax=Haladaptatus caseinilyticus TaxID=2993314 RepID=UPI0038991A8B